MRKYAIKITEQDSGVQHMLCQRFRTWRDAYRASEQVKDDGMPGRIVEVVKL